MLFEELRDIQTQIDYLDTKDIISKMENLEKIGTSFQNKHKQDVRKRYIVPIIMTILTVLFMAAVIAVLIWVFIVSRKEAAPMWFLWIGVATCFAVIVGVIFALRQRISEIIKGEEEDAKNY